MCVKGILFTSQNSAELPINGMKQRFFLCFSVMNSIIDRFEIFDFVVQKLSKRRKSVNNLKIKVNELCDILDDKTWSMKRKTCVCFFYF